MNRILIIGGNGCGKTTLAKILSHKLNLPLIHLDVLYWKDNWQPADKDEFDRQLLQELTKPQWIIDGNIARTIPLRLQYCDTVIYMDFPRSSCILGVIKRVIENYGKSRTDMGGYCPEKFDTAKFEFFKNTWSSHQKIRERFYTMLNNTSDFEIVVLKNRKQLKQFLKRLGD